MLVCNASVTSYKDSYFKDDLQPKIAIWLPTLEVPKV